MDKKTIEKNKARLEAIIEMRRKGAKLRVIGELFGISRQRVYQIWKRAMRAELERTGGEK
ncbi:MAG: helix-turn-helix domain-containing protein [Bellilinea sp.]